MVSVNPKLDRIRALMEQENLQAFVCFHMDQHNSEYIASCDERIAFISGFTGSNGVVVVTMTDAKMWTDGRYYIQAGKQLEQGWEMMKLEKGVTTWFEHIKETLSANESVGIDYSQYPASALKTRTEFFTKADINVKSCPVNLVDAVWGGERPPRPTSAATVLGMEFAGESSLDKQARIAEKMKDAEYDVMLITTLDDIMWMTNLRGTDIDYNPVFFSYALFYPKTDQPSLEVFVDEAKMAGLQDYLDSQKIKIASYERIEHKLKSFQEDDLKVGVHLSSCNAYMHSLLKDSAVESKNIIQETKCEKNVVEQEGMRQCNIRDCAAIMKYFAYLEEELRKEDHTLDEFTGARYLDNLRTHGQYHQGPSFDTISSIGANGAIIHYKPEQADCMTLNNREIYLLDSGGQYLDGTTDITRCGHFSGCEPTAFQKEAYTRVLLGTIDLERLSWPSDSTIAGGDMDVLARKNLWEAGLDYKHGTGHGVGSNLYVHEGPYGVGRGYKFKFVEGMCVSDEPGFYQEGEFGIRIENVIMCVKHPVHANFYTWENLTVAPYSRELIDKDLLSPKDIRFLDGFHAKCLEKLTPLLQDDERALAYVTRACAPL